MDRLALERSAMRPRASFWHGLWLPKGTPQEVIVKLHAAVQAALADATVRNRIADQGLDIPSPEQQTPEALAALQKAEIEKWWPIIKEAKSGGMTAGRSSFLKISLNARYANTDRSMTVVVKSSILLPPIWPVRSGRRSHGLSGQCAPERIPMMLVEGAIEDEVRGCKRSLRWSRYRSSSTTLRGWYAIGDGP